uniref:Complement component 6, duplicate 1 n=1 Tax=Cyprinodon variegatus TaxID=28743 RepID=A0A3Q2D029_CYPVA
MAPSCSLMLLMFLSCISGSLACHCDRYPWTSWSICTTTCNYGTQFRSRPPSGDDSYYWKNSCQQLCAKFESRACNEQACPINCVLSEFTQWSDCSPCARKQFRTRSVVRPSQFGGSECSVELTEERPCYPSKECQLPSVDCRDDFKCDNGRCINSTLTCNEQNDCGDNSDERDCKTFKVVCPDKRVAPGADLVGNGFDALAEEPRGVVLDNMFMGGSCVIKRPPSTLLYHRVPHNFKTFDIKVGVLEDFSTEPQEVVSESVEIKRTRQSETGSHDPRGFLFLLIVFHSSSGSRLTSNKFAFEASKKKDSKFFRVHQVLPISTFTVKEPQDLVLSLPFQQFLHALPLDYNYALYREIFQRFGTHYYSSGKLGGHYDLLYQYSREELKSSGESDERISGCLSRETGWTVILYSESSSVSRCTNNRMTEKYQGSFIQASEKSFSMVKGGRVREAEALTWEREGSAPNKTSYKNWAKSVLENPALVDYKVLPLIDLVRGIPCAVTKRRHLRRALLQYLEEFDTCKCAPCPNNARPVLSGTECKCVCQTGTFGTNCEKRASDYTSDAVDGYWSCWGPWSSCGASMRRHRTRKCDNPAPLSGGQPCDGPNKQEEPCHISLFERQESCDNDDDFTVGWRDELPPGVQGCLRPQRPPNSFLRKAKQYYSFGEDEEFQCFTGFELEGFQFINCRPDGTWSEPTGRCIRRLCVAPEVPENMELFPAMASFRVGERIGFNCKEKGLMPMPRGLYRCSSKMTWEPPLPEDLRCTDGWPFCLEGKCLKKIKVYIPDVFSSQSESVCILNVNLDVAVSMSPCSFLAGRCHGDPLFYITDGVCDSVDPSKLEWAKFRAKMSLRSSLHVPCNLDTCFDWETCSATKKCQCKAARDCPRTSDHMFCVKLKSTKLVRSMSLCAMAAIRCIGHEFEILNEGVCESR